MRLTEARGPVGHVCRRIPRARFRLHLGAFLDQIIHHVVLAQVRRAVQRRVAAIEAVKYCVELGNDVNVADNRGYTPLHGAAYLGKNDMVNYLVEKGAKVEAKSRAGDSPADMANGPTRFGQPHPETVALLEKLGSPNSHNCRSDQCVVASRSQIHDRRTPADYTQGAELDAFARSLGFTVG